MTLWGSDVWEPLSFCFACRRHARPVLFCGCATEVLEKAASPEGPKLAGNLSLPARRFAALHDPASRSPLPPRPPKTSTPAAGQ